MTSASRRLALGLGFAVVAAGLLGVWLFTQHDGTSILLQQVAKYKENPSHTDDYNRTISLIRNDLAHKAGWNQSDAEVLCELAATEYTFSGRVWDDSVPLSEIEAAGIQQTAVSTVGERLALGLPIEPKARAVLVKMLIDRTTNPHWRARLLACTVLVQAGLTDDDPSVRALVEHMKGDPDPDVAANAAGQLAHRDRVLTARAAAAERSGSH
ncbi:MAG: hypothetical protein IT437_05555 [Phycisphaerales bacterium]|nr:hypothetical protein [Phycisphaerales bacterium]